MPGFLDRYRQLPRAVVFFAAGQFLINLIQTAQFLLLNLFLKQGGLEDPEIAALGSKRFVATFLLAIPAGLWLRGKPLRGPLIAASIGFPLSALVGLEAAREGAFGVAAWAFFSMGFAGLVLSVASLPMVMRLAPEERKSEALSLLFAMWAAAAICGGGLASGLQALGQIQLGSWQVVLDAHATMLLLTVAGFGAPWFFMRLPDARSAEALPRHWLHVRRDDLGLLLRSLAPSVCLAVGAGLSIQFMNLFFSHVHGMSPAVYSGYSTVSSVLVLIAGILVPEVRRRFGWRGAILGVQLTAVVLLATMGFTELWLDFAWAYPFAVALFILRQPLMSMAGPATSELTMAYVGPRNHELMNACNGAIWSGAWWLAAVIFQHLRAAGVPYWQIFSATSILYGVAISAYYGLILATERSGSTSGETLHPEPVRRS